MTNVRIRVSSRHSYIDRRSVIALAIEVRAPWRFPPPRVVAEALAGSAHPPPRTRRHVADPSEYSL